MNHFFQYLRHAELASHDGQRWYCSTTNQSRFRSILPKTLQNTQYAQRYSKFFSPPFQIPYDCRSSLRVSAYSVFSAVFLFHIWFFSPVTISVINHFVLLTWKLKFVSYFSFMPWLCSGWLIMCQYMNVCSYKIHDGLTANVLSRYEGLGRVHPPTDPPDLQAPPSPPKVATPPPAPPMASLDLVQASLSHFAY